MQVSKIHCVGAHRGGILVAPTVNNKFVTSKLSKTTLRTHQPLKLRAAEADAPQTATTEDDDSPPPGCSRYSVALRKPLGLVLEETKDGVIKVAEVVEGGNASRASNEINVGDILIATSGYTRTTEQVYGEITVRGGEQIVRVQTRNEKFDTIMAAISSHPGNFEVTLEFQRCE